MCVEECTESLVVDQDIYRTMWNCLVWNGCTSRCLSKYAPLFLKGWL